MTTRLKNLMQTVCIILILMLFPSTARLQEQKGTAASPAAVQPGEAPVPPAQLPAASPAPAIATPAPEVEEHLPYIIKQGDTLWDIANALLKDPFLWPFIWKANPGITNPDLIFAGNRLIIPNLAPIEKALKVEAAPQEIPVEKQKQAKETAAIEKPVPAPEITRQEGITGAHVVAPKPIQPAPAAISEEVPAGNSGLILPEEQNYPVIDKYAMISAGFVNEEETKDTITGSRENGKVILGYDDIVYVSLRDADSVKIGDKYLIFTSLHKVKHPKTRKEFGNLIKGLGLLQIIAKDPAANVLTGRIVISFDVIEKGNMLTPYQEPTPIYHSSQKKAKDISGYILEVTDMRSINAQTDVVYLDRGNADGVEPGDGFLVYQDQDNRAFPRKVIGEVRVILVKEHTSTAIVQKSSEPISKGYAVDFKK